MKTADTAAESVDRLGAVVQLLDRAARVALYNTPGQGGDFAAHSLGHGIYLAWAQACAMLPTPYEPTATPPPTDDAGVTQLLIAAEECTRELPLHGVGNGLSQFVVDLCDLIREARALGY